jgi:hypothetical protein
MASTSTAEFQAAPQTPPPPIVLRNWPIWDEPLTAWPMLLAAGGLSALAAVVADAPLAGGIVGALLAVTLWRLWLPVWFEIGPRGVIEVLLGQRRRIAWNSIAVWRTRRRGVFLSPFSGSPLRSAMRGLYIFCGDRKSEVAACLEYYLRAR